MSKKPKKNVEVPVEIVENLIESLEWALSSLNFWKRQDKFPCNLICKVFADFYYQFRKLVLNNEKYKK